MIIQFVLIGLSTGSLYVLGALGLVVVKRSSGVINFSHSAIGMVATFLFWELHDNEKVTLWLSLALSLAFACALGALIYLLVMRRLRERSQLIQLVATLAIMSILIAAISLHYTAVTYSVSAILPTTLLKFGGVTIGLDRTLIFAGVLVSVALLWAFYRFSQFGRLTTAVADNSEAAAGLGVSSTRVSALNWAIGAGLAGLAGIFLAPIVGLSTGLATLLIVPMLSAALVGNFASFPLTLVGGLVIGAAQSLLTEYTTTPGLVSIVPAVVAAAVLISRGRGAPARGDSMWRMPSIGAGRVRPMLAGLAGAALLVVVWLVPPNWLDAVSLQVAISIILLSLVVVVGYCGQLSLAQFSFAGIGGWLSGTLATYHGWPIPLAMLATIIVAVIFGAVVAFAGSRTRGLNLAILTMAVAVVLDNMIFSNVQLQGGESGLYGILTPPLSLFGWRFDYFTHPRDYTTVAVVVLGLLLVGVANMRRSKVGRTLLSVRANERAASSLGISVVGAKVYAFSAGAAIASIGGVLLAYTQPYLSFTNEAYGLLSNVTVLQDAVVGGVGWASGAPVGSLLQPGSTGTLLLGLLGTSFQSYVFLVGGLLLLVTILQGPDGIVPNVVRQVKGLHWLRFAFVSPNAFRDRSGERGVTKVAPRELRLADVTIRYGGVQAVADLSVCAPPGKITSLIGPNGAGKTSVLDAITGFTRISTGQVCLDGSSIDRLTPHARARRGVGRSFQSLELFSDMTVLENLLAASEDRDWKSYLSAFVLPAKARLTSAGRAAVVEFGLDEVLDRLPGELPYGRQRMLAIARAVAAEPSVLLLDEPAAGLDEVEAREVAQLIRRLATDWGMAVLLIEHNMELVMSISDQVYAIDFGHLIAEGKPEEVRMNPKVLRAYLGEDLLTAEADRTDDGGDVAQKVSS